MDSIMTKIIPVVGRASTLTPEANYIVYRLAINHVSSVCVCVREREQQMYAKWFVDIYNNKHLDKANKAKGAETKG